MLQERASVRLLIGAWALLLLYGEVIAFYLVSWRCSWPSSNGKADVVVQHESFDASINANAKETALFRMAIVADPQLTDFYSYSQKNGLLLRLTEFYSDIFMYRAFRYSVMRRPYADSVMFLGDLFDGGRVATEEQYHDHLRRFLKISGSVAANTHSGVRFIAGNHDVGLGGFYSPKAAALFAKHFGLRNYSFNVHTSEFVVVDSVAMTHDAYLQMATVQRIEEMRQAKAFLESLDHDFMRPRVVFTHIPLWRPDRAQCNESLWRGKPALRQGFGVSYQNQLSKKTSMDVLGLYPQLVFSGDDHDRCLYYHIHQGPTDTVYGTNILKIPEVTVPTFSWLQGTSYPGFGLLTVETKVLWVERKHKIVFVYNRATRAAMTKKSEKADIGPCVRLLKRESVVSCWPQFYKILVSTLAVYAVLLFIS